MACLCGRCCKRHWPHLVIATPNKLREILTREPYQTLPPRWEGRCQAHGHPDAAGSRGNRAGVLRLRAMGHRLARQGTAWLALVPVGLYRHGAGVGMCGLVG